MKLGAAKFSAIAFLLLALQAGAASPCPLPAAITISSDLMGVSFLALMVSVNVIAIGYMISRLFPHLGLRRWIDTEFFELAKSAILIAGIFAILAFMGNLSVLLAPPGEIVGASSTYSGSIFGLEQGACAYLESIKSGLGNTFDYMLALSGTVGALQSMTVGLYVPIPLPPTFEIWFEFGYLMQPYQNTMLESMVTTGTYESLANDAITLIVMPMTFLILAQLTLMPVLVSLGLAVMLPLGIALRAFPFVRGIGGTLVAIGIGTAIVYPALLVLLNWPVTNALKPPVYTTTSASCGANVAVCYLTGLFVSAFSGSASSLNGFWDGLQALNSVYPAINGILNNTYYLTLQYFLFISDLAIAFPLVDTIARSLSGTIRLSLGGKLKLV